MDDAAKKKQHTSRELLAGGGLFLLALPLVGFALVMSLFAILVSVGLMFSQPEMNQGAFIMLAVYGVCVGMIGFLTMRVLRRSGFLIKRIRGLHQEKQRTSNLMERDTSRLETDESEMNVGMLSEPEARLKNRE